MSGAERTLAALDRFEKSGGQFTTSFLVDVIVASKTDGAFIVIDSMRESAKTIQEPLLRGFLENIIDGVERTMKNIEERDKLRLAFGKVDGPVS